MSKKKQFIAENDEREIEDKVIGQLDRSAKLDEVDTVTFGLETDDGKIVKVFVNAEQANDFEKALADKLGEVDDIEEALNELSKDFEIIDVEWPGEEKEDEESDSDDGQPETDGSESLNQKVYNNSNENKDQAMKAKLPTSEGKRYRFKDTLTEESFEIEDKMTTATQLLIYHAIIELGIPEIALNRSPYKSAIISSIRRRSQEVHKEPSLKAALKMFVQRSHGIDSKKKKKLKESVEEMIQESVVEDFWEGVIKILRYLSPDQETVDKLVKSQKFKTLVSRASPGIPRTINTHLRTRLNWLTDTMDSTDPVSAITTKTKVSEAIKPDAAADFLSDLLSLVDNTPTKSLSSGVLKSAEWRNYFLKVRPELPKKFGSGLAKRFGQFRDALNDALAARDTKEGPKEAKITHVKEEVKIEKILIEAIVWDFEKSDDLSIISTEGLKMTLDSEQLEKAIKGINTKSVVVVNDSEDPRNKFTFSPRGNNVIVKRVGEQTHFQMDATHVQDFINLVAVQESVVSEATKEDDEQHVIIGNIGRGRQTCWPRGEEPGLYTKAEAEKIADEMNGKQTMNNAPAGRGHTHWHAKPLSKALDFVAYGNTCYSALKKIVKANEEN